jgi:hypothetical protein
LDHRRRNSSISLRVRRIKLRPTLHVGWLAVFRAIRFALGIILSGQLGFVNAANQNAEQPAPQKPRIVPPSRQLANSIHDAAAVSRRNTPLADFHKCLARNNKRRNPLSV